MIYFIKAANKYVKIGVSKDPHKRLKELQTGNPLPLKLILTMPGSFDTEKALHDYFKSARVEGEWFRLSGKEIKNCILALDHPNCKWKSPSNIKQFIENGLHYYLLQKAKRNKKLKSKIRQYSVETT